MPVSLTDGATVSVAVESYGALIACGVSVIAAALNVVGSTERNTVASNPPLGVTPIVNVVCPPPTTLPVDGDAVIVNPCDRAVEAVSSRRSKGRRRKRGNMQVLEDSGRLPMSGDDRRLRART